MNRVCILMIEDDAAIVRLLEIALQSNQFKTLAAHSAEEGKRLIASHQPDLILLDLGLPDQDGQVLLKDLRQWYARPVIILSARSGENDIVGALDNGANDYLTKPFRTGELLARIRSAMRFADKEVWEHPIKQFGNLSVDLAARWVKKAEKEVKLTATEFALLALFVKNEGKVLTHAFILREVWGPGYTERTEYPRVFVGQLRKKIEDAPNHPRLIRTESGIGYRFLG